MSTIQVQTIVNLPVYKVWEYWTMPEHITKWNQADSTWHCPEAVNDLRVDGKFSSKMAAKDGSASFDFSGYYTLVDLHNSIESVLDDGRKVQVHFEKIDESTTRLTELFEPENQNSQDLQRSGWQSILDSFKNYAQSA